MEREPNFVVSLDFELYWGMHDVRSLDDCRASLEGVPRAIDRILALFDRYAIHATWATVGFLMANGSEDCLAAGPERLPSYDDRGRSPYALLEPGGAASREPHLFFGPALVRRVLSAPHQELGTHTYSHYYCLESGQSLDDFRADLRAAKKMARRFDVTLESIVFPRNQYRSEHLRVCGEEGIVAFRGNPDVFMYHGYAQDDLSLFIRGPRLMDSVVPVVPIEKIAHVPAAADGIVDVAQSRFLRPASSSRALRELRLRRILSELRSAVKARRDYHLWWHPHNFGSSTEENLALLEEVLRHVDFLRTRFGLRSKTMGEVAHEVLAS